ncbi:MAG: NlpC/P60 family protein [Pseudomonadota bacterium]
MAGADRRLTPARADLAAAHLQGQVEATRFAEPTRMRVTASRVALLAQPDANLAPDTELLLGEDLDVFETANGWAWGQSVLDDYVGYLRADEVGEPEVTPDHAVRVLACPLYAEPHLKRATGERLSFGARVLVTEKSGDFVRDAAGRWLPADHLHPLSGPRSDWVAVAEMFLGVPYVWGGRSSFGLDCSALVQLALQAAGRTCPRDSDMQQAGLGRTLDPGTPPRRGDLFFWKGHVGIMTNTETLLHATAYRMQVLKEPLSQAIRRIEAVEFGEVLRHARLDP